MSVVGRDRGWLSRLVPPLLHGWLGAPLLVVGWAAPVLLFRTSLVEPFRIPAGSMTPTLLVGDHVLVAKYRYGLRLPVVGRILRWGEPRRGDVVVFPYPPEPSLTYVKRVIGVPGDRVSVRGDRPTVNGAPVEWVAVGDVDGAMDEACEVPDRLAGFTEAIDGRAWPVARSKGMPGPLADADEVVVPEGHVFVLGDNRSFSEDSRRWGVVPIDDVLGEVEHVWFSWDACSGQVRPERLGRRVAPEGG